VNYEALYQSQSLVERDSPQGPLSLGKTAPLEVPGEKAQKLRGGALRNPKKLMRGDTPTRNQPGIAAQEFEHRFCWILLVGKLDAIASSPAADIVARDNPKRPLSDPPANGGRGYAKIAGRLGNGAPGHGASAPVASRIRISAVR
jgi:hypothetical protein